MVNRVVVVAAFAVACGALPARAQTTARVGAPGSEVVVTVHPPAAPSVPATVLLLPGWGGGPSDALGIAGALSAGGVGVVVLSPRGWHGSGGTATFAHALEDIAVALDWVRDPARSGLGLRNEGLVLGGHSWGGGMALAYAARDPSVHRIFSVAGTDHARLIRGYRADPRAREIVDAALAGTAAPEGPIRFDVEATLAELERGEGVYGLVENAPRLADRSLLLFGGWEDGKVTVDDTLLPLYRALRAAGADDVTFVTYHADHGFGNVREALHRDLLEWIRR